MSYSVDDTKSILLHRSVLNKKWEICCLCNVIQLSRFGPLLPKSLFLFLLPLAFLFYFSSQGTITGVNNARGSSGLRAVWTGFGEISPLWQFFCFYFILFLGLVSIWQHLERTLAIFMISIGHIFMIVKANIEKWILPSGHTAQENLWCKRNVTQPFKWNMSSAAHKWKRQPLWNVFANVTLS